MNKALKIIYEDNDMLVCEKRAGLAVQSGRVGRRDLESLVRTHLMKQSGRRENYLAVIHRLDQPVEGILVFAKTKQAAADLSEQIRTHTAEKYYLAVTENVFEQTKGVLTDYLYKEPAGNYSKVVDASCQGAKEARLEYEVLASGERYQLVRIHLLTGRHHQIRVQLSHAGHPIAGDVKYHPGCDAEKRTVYPALCAARLVLTHPVSRKRMTFEKHPEGEAFKEFMPFLNQ